MLFSIFDFRQGDKLTETARTHGEAGNSRRLHPISPVLSSDGLFFTGVANTVLSRK